MRYTKLKASIGAHAADLLSNSPGASVSFLLQLNRKRAFRQAEVLKIATPILTP